MSSSNRSYGFFSESDVIGEIEGELSQFRCLLRCTVCGLEQPLGDIGDKLSHGWPQHCGYTMKWVTQRLLDEERAALKGIEMTYFPTDKRKPNICIEDGCNEVAGTPWTVLWCPRHDQERRDRITKSTEGACRPRH